MTSVNPECLALLRAQSLFRDLSDAELAQLADLAEEHEVPEGTVLSRQADVGTTLFLIAEGEAVVHRVDEQGLQRPVGMLGPGAAYGITSLILGEPRDATVSARSPMRVWTIHTDAFQDLLDANPEMEARLNLPSGVQRKLQAPLLSWLEPQEMVMLLTRRHWMAVLVPASVTTLLVGLAAAVLLLVVGVGASPTSSPWLAAIAGVWLMAMAWHWIDWRNDYLAVTTRRVAHHERLALLYESRHEAPLDRVQNVFLKRGVGGSLLGYGDLTIETAAHVGQIEFRHAPRPGEVRDAIFSELARMQATKRAAERHLIHEELVERISIENPGSLADRRSDSEAVEHPAVEAGRSLQPGPLARVLRAVARSGIWPHTRIETAEGVMWRRHIVFLMATVFQPGALFVLAVALALMARAGRPEGVVAAVPSLPQICWAVAAGALGWAWWRGADWANDLYMVTDERIVDIEKRPLFFSEERREATLGVIQNVRFEMPNPLAAILNYGDVRVQTAGAGEFTFNQVPNPREVQQEIFRRIEAFRQRQRDRDAARRRSELAEWLTVYDKLRAEQGRAEDQPTSE